MGTASDIVKIVYFDEESAIVLVLPPHVRLHDRMSALEHLRDQHVERLLLLRRVRVPEDRPDGRLLAPEVVGGRKASLAPLLLELGRIRPQFLPRAVRQEVAPQQFSKVSPPLSL